MAWHGGATRAYAKVLGGEERAKADGEDGLFDRTDDVFAAEPRVQVAQAVPRDPPRDQARKTSVDGGKRERLPTVRGEAFFILI